MESTPDQEWQLSYGTLGNPGADIDVQVLVDGKWVDRHHMRKTGAGQVPKHCEGSQSKDRTTVAPFLFTRLKVGGERKRTAGEGGGR